MEYEIVNPNLKEILDIEQSIRVAKRLLGPPKFTEGKYMSIHAKEELSLGDFLIVDDAGNASRWSGVGIPNGTAVANLTKGNYGWALIKL